MTHMTIMLHDNTCNELCRRDVCVVWIEFAVLSLRGEQGCRRGDDSDVLNIGIQPEAKSARKSSRVAKCSGGRYCDTLKPNDEEGSAVLRHTHHPSTGSERRNDKRQYSNDNQQQLTMPAPPLYRARTCPDYPVGKTSTASLPCKSLRYRGYVTTAAHRWKWTRGQPRGGRGRNLAHEVHCEMHSITKIGNRQQQAQQLKMGVVLLCLHHGSEIMGK